MIDAMADHRRATRSRAWAAPVRWAGAAAIVCATHVGGAWMALHWPHASPPPGEPPPAVMIELAPVAVAPEAPPQEVAPGPEMTEAQPEPVAEPMEEPQPEPEIKIPDLPQVPEAQAVLTPPPPPKPRVERKPPPPKPVQKVERKPPINPERPRTPRTTAPPTAQAARANMAAAPAAGAAQAPSMSSASWFGSIMAHLNRYKRAPAGGSTGTAKVAFTIDRSGRVLSARLIGSSGDSALDDEAVAMVRRASPVPAPPASVGSGGTVNATVPVRYSR